ncbi:PLDc N-terminal domain-containing protein [Salinibacterium sp. SYSU T00001]|uniref:PLD nuclease N-terminal domain-containing protein n=1 Tax=Homoserinimonas sedimenticola TaxID=2986805 RepID=UPI002235A10B|nr:PLD nuclease N-terminal domain-containing protein [Salinibacterium sedimenticola]MCW4385966.1 PLDc N-terminal domain-containing protein [Salinibacterium sedimenticola]
MRAFLPVFGAALLLAFWVYALVDCIRTDEFRARGLPKGAWIFIVIILPLIGGILWFTIGKERMPRPGSRAAASRPVYPDDDPAFLRSVNSEAEREQRIRDLEEKLAELDDEDNSDSRGANGEPKG